MNIKEFGIMKELYDITLKIIEIKPWDFLWDADLISINLPDYDQPVYCSVIGRCGECFGICAYHTAEGIIGYDKIASGLPIPQEQIIRYQRCLTFYLGDREELSKKDRDIIKELGLKFRGKNSWVYFRSFEYKYVPAELDPEDAKLLTGVFKNLYIVLKDIAQKRIKPNFKDNNMIHVYFDENKKPAFEVVPTMIPEPNYEIPVLQDDLLVSKLKKKKKIQLVLEMDIAYMNIPVQEKEYKKPFIFRSFIMADNETGEIITNEPVAPDDDETQLFLGCLAEFIDLNGIPGSIVVRDEYFGSLVLDLCDRLNINLTISPELDSTDDFVKAFSQNFN